MILSDLPHVKLVVHIPPTTQRCGMSCSSLHTSGNSVQTKGPVLKLSLLSPKRFLEALHLANPSSTLRSHLRHHLLLETSLCQLSWHLLVITLTLPYWNQFTFCHLPSSIGFHTAAEAHLTGFCIPSKEPSESMLIIWQQCI